MHYQNLFRSIITELRISISNKVSIYNLDMSTDTQLQIFRTVCLNLDG